MKYLIRYIKSQWLSLTLFSLHRIKIKINGLNLSSIFISMTLSLSNLNLISLTLSLRHRLNSQVSNVLSISICLSLYLRQILKSKAWNFFTKSSSLTQTLSVSHSLISAVRQSLTPFTNFIRNLKCSLFKSFDLRSSHQWTDHTLKNSVLTLPLSTPRSKP